MWVASMVDTDTYSPQMATRQVTETLKFVWPFVVSVFLIIALLSLAARGNVSILVNLFTLSLLSILNIVACFYTTKFLNLFGPLMHILAMPIAYGFFKLAKRFWAHVFPDSITVDRTLIEKHHWASCFSPPNHSLNSASISTTFGILYCRRNARRSKFVAGTCISSGGRTGKPSGQAD